MQSSLKSTQQPRFSILYNAYKKAHPDDTVRPSEFSDDILAACPPEEQSRCTSSYAATKTSKLSLRKAGENVPSTPNSQISYSSPHAFAADGIVSSAVAESKGAPSTKPSAIGKMSNTLRSNGMNDPESTPATGRKLPWPSSGGPPISSTPIAIRKGGAEASKQLRSSASFFKAFTTPKPPSTAPARTKTALALQPSPAPSVSRPPPRTAIDQTTHQSRQEQPRSPVKIPAVVNRPRADAFKAFAQAYRDLKPGGAFAATTGSNANITNSQSGQRPGKQRLDVLSWQL